MSHWKLKSLIVVLLVVLAFVGKMEWDEYQYNRAAEKMPEVLKILDRLEMPDGIVKVKTTTSINEYSASAWHYYKAELSATHLEARVRQQIEPSGFIFYSTYPSYGGPQYSFRKGEYEVIVSTVGSDGGPPGANVALSVNWNGLER